MLRFINLCFTISYWYGLMSTFILISVDTFRVNRESDSAVEISFYRPATAVNEWSPSPKKPPLKVKYHLFCGVCRCCGYIWQMFVK